MCEASKPFHALEHLVLLCRGFSAFWPAGSSTSSRPIVIFRLIIFRLVRHDRFIFLSSLSSLFVCSVFQGNHDESLALATQCETPCATRLSYHGICTILRAIGTIYVIRKCPIVSSESDISHPILVYRSRNNNSQAQARRFPALTAPEPEFPVIFGSKWDPLTSAWRQGGASPERLAELPTSVSPLQKRI